ncbi:hypothetical protein BC835DRAFT_475832 [Cytidiella melzeri]|nr:hypothetical protein BC835DRAFT_475832 [Cytidiella melzeri]
MAVPSASQQGRPSPPPPPKWPTVEELQTYSKEQLRLLAVRMNIPLIIHNTKDEILALVVKKMNDKSARGLSKDRSLRVAVIEKDILKSRKIGPPGQAAQIVEKTEDRTFNPHKALIAQEGRRRSGQPLQAESTEEDLDTVSDNSNDATAAMPSGTFAAENPVKNRMLARQPTEKMAAYSSNSDVATSQLSSRPVTAQIPARNGALTRQSTLSRVSHLQLQRSPAKNPAVLTPRSVQATAQHPPSHRVLTGQATTRTQHAQKPVEKTAASPSKSIQHAPSASSSQNIFRSPVGNPMLTRQPTIHIPSVQKQPSKVISRQPSKNVDNGAAVASSSRAIAQNPSGNGTLTRQRTIRIPNVQQQHRGEAEKEEQRRDNKFDDMRAVQRIGGRTPGTTLERLLPLHRLKRNSSSRNPLRQRGTPPRTTNTPRLTISSPIRK